MKFKVNDGKGEIQKETIGRVTCSRYAGEFHSPHMMSRANTGLWYTSVSVNPFVVQGEGNTPKAAIEDSIARTEDRIKKMQKGIDAMRGL